MYKKAKERRSLGMMTRKIVQKSFSGERYLREHEQMLWIGKSARHMATRTAGDLNEPTDIATAVQQTAAIEEEIITIPRSAVDSWRSSTSGMSTLYSSVSNMRPGAGTRASSSSGGYNRAFSVYSGASNISTDTDSFLRLPSSASLPVFAPRRTFLPGSASGNLSPTKGHQSRLSTNSYTRSISTAGREQLRGLDREDFNQYRNSDVSSIMRDEFLRSSAFWRLSG